MPDTPPPDPDPEDAWIARDPLPAEPMPIVERWLAAAWSAGVQRNPHATVLATVDPDGRPSARYVLCKGIDAAAGTVRFFSQRESRKGRALAIRPEVALAFYFSANERQVRVEGPAREVPPTESDAYFASRPLSARLGAWASRQSEPIASRAALERRLAEVAERYGVPASVLENGDAGSDAEIPRPPGWVGWGVEARRVELWRGRDARLHDRALYIREGAGSMWEVSRLQP